MKSSALPITSAEADAPRPAATPRIDVAAFEALLVPAILKPVVDALGPLGATFGDVIARAAFSGTTDRTEP